MTERTIENRLQQLEAKSIAHGMALHFVISEMYRDDAIRSQIRDGFLRALQQVEASSAPFPPEVAMDEVAQMFAGFGPR